ncbi:hypothetical protein GCM10027431_21500 [Lysobacter rhizosphaerae]
MRQLPETGGNPKGRPRGVVDRRNEWREALASHLPALIDQLVAKAKAGDKFAIKLILERVAPPLRPHSQPILIAGMENVSLTTKAEAVLKAIGAGQVPVDAGRGLLDAISVVAKITEIDDLLKRVQALEQKKETTP